MTCTADTIGDLLLETRIAATQLEYRRRVVTLLELVGTRDGDCAACGVEVWRVVIPRGGFVWVDADGRTHGNRHVADAPAAPDEIPAVAEFERAARVFFSHTPRAGHLHVRGEWRGSAFEFRGVRNPGGFFNWQTVQVSFAGVPFQVTYRYPSDDYRIYVAHAAGVVVRNRVTTKQGQMA